MFCVERFFESYHGMGRAPCCDKMGLKKGPWTPDEDQKLVAYIQRYGHGSWRALPKQAGMWKLAPESCIWTPVSRELNFDHIHRPAS